jgi:hypothetical protein
MADKNKLEQIFWKRGKWVNHAGKEVNPRPIGVSEVAEAMVSVKQKNEVYSLEMANKNQLLRSIEKKLEEVIKNNPNEKEYLKVNAYSKGNYGSAILTGDGAIISFYQIIYPVTQTETTRKYRQNPSTK